MGWGEYWFLLDLGGDKIRINTFRSRQPPSRELQVEIIRHPNGETDSMHETLLTMTLGEAQDVMCALGAVLLTARGIQDREREESETSDSGTPSEAVLERGSDDSHTD